jgi:hypothetical protein
MVRGPKKAQLTDEHVALVLAAAKGATEILQSHGIPSAIFGSLASKLYGAPRPPKVRNPVIIQVLLSPFGCDRSPIIRSMIIHISLSAQTVYTLLVAFAIVSDAYNLIPKDVDILTVPAPGFSENSGSLLQEELKALIAHSRPQDFYLKDPKNPDDTYKILMFRPSPNIDHPARSQEDIIKRADPECKVDILAPGTMHLPHLRTEYIHWVDEIPLVLFSLLLVQKLQAWDDNRNAEEPFRRYRQHKDAKDVKKLLGLKEFVEVLTQIGSDGWTNTELFSEEFQALTEERVKGYVREFSSSAKHWMSLGFHLA